MTRSTHSGILLAFLFCISLLSCDEETYIPKPRGYFKIPLPEKQYQVFDQSGYPYSFEIPVYAKVNRDTLFFDEKTENPWWINIDIPALGGKIYMSYKQINAEHNLAKLLEDSYRMSHYHSKRADYIDDPPFHTPNNVHGLFYEVGGNAASAYQFFATDSVKHFIRGALYFDVTPNADSLKPVNEFLREDMMHLVQTLRWKP